MLFRHVVLNYLKLESPTYCEVVGTSCGEKEKKGMHIQIVKTSYLTRLSW